MKTRHATIFIAVAISALVFNSCKKDKDEPEPEPAATTPPATACSPSTSFVADTASGPRLIFKFKFDSTQVRLDNFGNPSTIPSGNAAQSPVFNLMSQHYIELAGNSDQLGQGVVLYNGASTTLGGSNAINYCSSVQTPQNVVFFSKALSQIDPGTYDWLRLSLAYQNYDITYKANAIPGTTHLGTGTVASFIGFRTYVTGYKINGHDHVPSSSAGGPGNHAQGYWGFETTVLGTNYFSDGQAPGTTVPNPLFATSPIPAGSCVVTGKFVDNSMANSPLVITGAETSDIIITVSLSTNKSFEWHEVTADGYYQPEVGETVADMGVRGMIPVKN
ncbi:MAG: hypothetical protein K0Q95_1338 [Bacteroidota bacterium]|nr:hypothetical protein [Bacteroidota bacterium]